MLAQTKIAPVKSAILIIYDWFNHLIINYLLSDAKRKKQLLIVDHYDYGDTPIAQITIFQSQNKATSKMGVNDTLRRAFFEIHDLSNYMRDIEYWANNVEARRARAFANYKIGQEQKNGKK